MVRAWTTQHTTAEIVERAARAARPGRAGRRRPRGAGARAGAGARPPAARPDRHVLVPAPPWMIDGELPPAPSPAPALDANRGEPAPLPSSAPDADRRAGAAARRRPRARPHGVVGGAVGHRDVRRARRRGDPRRVDPARGRDAHDGRHVLDRPSGGSTAGSSSRPTTNKRGLTLDLDQAPGRDAAAAARRAGRPRRRELHAAGARGVRPRLGRDPRDQPAHDDGAHAGLRSRRAVARPARASPRRWSRSRAWPG